MRFLKLQILLLLLLLPLRSFAQFFLTGDDPGKLRWSYIESENFKIIFPRGYDSLAYVYGRNLEQFRIPVSRSMCSIPCGPDNALNRKMPIVLHTHNGNNGSVAWAPKRMDMFTIPPAYAPDPTPWDIQLCVHELRHVSQLQFGLTKTLKPGNYIFGEMWNGLAAILYPGAPELEGDAVIIETALTKSGRGRISDFLNYYRVAFDNGEYRKWKHWRFESQRNYSPDHYALGYMTLGGFRYLHDCPTIMGEALQKSAKNPLKFKSIWSDMKKVSGKKFRDTFMEVCDTLGRMWKEEADARAPYIPSERVSEEPRLYTDYASLVFSGDQLYASKKGFITSPILVNIKDNGKEKTLSRLAAQTSNIKADNKGRLWWNETVTDERWSLETGSLIKMRDGGKEKKISKRCLKYNPSPSPSGKMVSVINYDVKGGSRLEILDENSAVILSFPSPDTLQLVETIWMNETDIYASGLSSNGYGIYHFNLNENILEMVLEPQPVMLKELNRHENEIIFTCDRTGVNELYHLNPYDGKLKQKTSIRHGGSSFAYSPNGEFLYYTSLTLKGHQIFRTPVSDLFDKKTDFTEFHKYAIAEKLAEQERELAAEAGEDLLPIDGMSEFSAPQKYRKLPNAFNVHSWAPVYMSVDNIMNMSFDRFYQALSPGVSGIIQNNLSTAVGEFGYSAHKDPYNKQKWRHSGHVKFTYSGLYPVIELSADFNDRAIRQYNISSVSNHKNGYVEIASRELDAPYFNGNLALYIPFNFSSGGWYRGLIPKVSYTLTNDRFNTSHIMMTSGTIGGGLDGSPAFAGAKEGKNILRQYLSASLRGYTMLSTPNSAVYPKLGIGLEMGVNSNLGLNKYLSPVGYMYGYGYLPGITAEQGIKLTALYQQKLCKNAVFGQAAVNVLPRGLKNNSPLLNWFSIRYPSMIKLTADYTIPVFIGNLVLGDNIIAVKRLVVTPNFDCAFIERNTLWSVGADLVFDLESIATLAFPVSLGVSYSYNGGFGGSFDSVSKTSGIQMNRHFIGPVFSVTL